MRLLDGLLVLSLALPASVIRAQDDSAPIEVMIFGTYHFANPDLDVANIEADDVRVPRRQAEIAALVESLPVSTLRCSKRSETKPCRSVIVSLTGSVMKPCTVPSSNPRTENLITFR